MVRHSVCIFTAVIAVGLSTLTADGRAEQQTGFSPQTAAVFVKTAQEIVAADPTAIDAAMLFLDAAEALERAAARPSEQRLRIGAESCVGRTDYSEAMAAALQAYVGRQYDLEAALAALRCMLTRMDTRLEREVLLDTLLRRYVSVSPWLGSELATQLGLLAAEKTDMDGAMDRLNQAYHLNPYNQLAFAALQDVYAAGDRVVSAEAAAVQLRRMLDANPYDLGRSLGMANVLRQVELYPQAAAMCEYTDRVFRYHYPDQTAGQSLYLPWIMSCYHSPRLVGQCLDLAERFRDTEVLDLKLEAAAGRAAAKLGRPEQARRILEQAAERAEQMLGQTDLALPIWPEHLAWFYSFVLDRPDHALAWSNQAFSQASDRSGVRAIFAYTLAVNDQHELAAQYAEATAATEQAAAITMALVRRSQDQTQQAIDLLRSAIAMAPETFESEKARSLLADMGSEYLSPAYTQEIEKQLTETFGVRMLPAYLEPQQRFAAKLQLSGGEVVYGAELDPRLVLENNSSAPLVIQDEAMLAGFIRVDAAVRGDITMDLPNLLSMRFRPNQPIMPNEHLFVPLDLRTGKLRQLLMAHPQASLEVVFTVYLDPVVAEDGTVSNALAGTSPVTASFRRRGVSLTREFMIQRLDALARGQEGQKMQAATLFAGLLAEHEAMTRGQVRYAHTEVERELLTDAVRRALTDENWRLRVHTMSAIDALSLPADYALIQTLSGNLNHDQWPVRFMSLHVLSGLQKEQFQPVLDWKAQYDAHNLNRRLAVALGGKEPPQPQREPAAQP